MSCGATLPVMAEIPPRPCAPIKVGISDCLLGSQVRYDGGHKRSSLPHEELAGLFEFVGLCPEVAVGLGTPREPIRLEGEPENPRVVSIHSREDVTDRITAYAKSLPHKLDTAAGYIFMKNSPSCGLSRVKVYPSTGRPKAQGQGVFSREISICYPTLPLEESGRLFDPVLRENFVMRTFVFAHWQALLSGELSGELTASQLIEFHSRYKYLLMAHSVRHYKQCGRLLSDLSNNLLDISQRYFSLLMKGLAQPASRGTHANVLAHLQGYVKHALPAADRQELARLIEEYRSGSLPLLAPLTLLRHHLKYHAEDYALQQIYLDPHPAVAGLRRAL